MNNFTHVLFISFLLSIVCSSIEKLTSDEHANKWRSIQMPNISYFPNFPPPDDPIRWQIAIEHAINGTQLLLMKVLHQIPDSSQVLCGDTKFRWLHKKGDIFLSESNFKAINTLIKEKSTALNGRAPLTFLGHLTFANSNFKGALTGQPDLNIRTVINAYKKKSFSLPSKIVAIGGMNENWGYLSTHILNRTWSVI